MKKHAIISIFLIGIFVLLPMVAFAANFIKKATVSFGGKVIATTIPSVTCIGFGTGPILLSSNVSSIVSGIYSGVDSSQSASSRTAGVISGLYGALPYYANTGISVSGGAIFVSGAPKIGDWILGRTNLIPNFTKCVAGGPSVGIPIPVKDTTQYKISGHTSSL
jgi:hypothetical protein